jgi:DNA-binding PadR family transcriptional regulator
MNPPFSSPESFIPLTPAVFHILLALAGGERHGYAIMRDVEQMSGGKVAMGPGTLYGSIKRMLASGLIVETGIRPDPQLDDQRRRYYQMTSLGSGVLAAESRRLESLVRAIRAKRVHSDPEDAA